MPSHALRRILFSAVMGGFNFHVFMASIRIFPIGLRLRKANRSDALSVEGLEKGDHLVLRSTFRAETGLRSD
jgi:hypothetical protein